MPVPCDKLGLEGELHPSGPVSKQKVAQGGLILRGMFGILARLFKIWGILSFPSHLDLRGRLGVLVEVNLESICICILLRALLLEVALPTFLSN